MPMILDFDELDAYRHRCEALTARIRAGDLGACWDAEGLLAEIHAATDPVRQHVEATVALEDRALEIQVIDGLWHLLAICSGAYTLQLALDDARDPDLTID